MVATWIETAAKGRHGGPVRAGMWSSVVLGTYPIESNQEVWLEVMADDVVLGNLPAFWTENKGVNSLWHVPIPPQSVGARLHYRSVCRSQGDSHVSHYQDTIVRPNLPDRTEASEIVLPGPEGLVGNRMMTVKVDSRGSTYDVYYPTVGLHSDVRPAEGDLPQSRSHFRGIVAGLAVGRRLDWFTERRKWEVFQHYQGATNLLMTELNWRHGPIRVLATDFAVMGKLLPRTAGGTQSPGQYVKRFRVQNDGSEPRRALFAIYVQAEINGGIGEPGLTWHDGDRALLAMNRGHSHVNRKLARDATVEFAIAYDGRGEVHCEPTGPNEALLLRWLDLPAGESTTVDFLVSGAFTGWKGDPGTFEHWLHPALTWFRSTDLDQVEQATAMEWDAFIEPLPNFHFPRPSYPVHLRRSALAAALHADATEGAVASGFDRGLNAYCRPRDAIWVGGTFDRLGHPEIGRNVYRWLSALRGQNRPYTYWFQKYTMDGTPEWETPAVDHSALIPWGLERHCRRTGDLESVTRFWPMIERAAGVAMGHSGHFGLKYLEDIQLVASAGIWDHRHGAFFYSNCTVVAGLRAAARLAEQLGKKEFADRWKSRADAVWENGILAVSTENQPNEPGLFDGESDRFLAARRLSTLHGVWAEDPSLWIERCKPIDISMLGVVVPLGLLPAADPRVTRTVEAILKGSQVEGESNALVLRSVDPSRDSRSRDLRDIDGHDISSLATLWMAQYLIQLGRETGQGRHWTNALAMLDAVLARLLPLGLSLRVAPRFADAPARSETATSSGVWGLHSMIIETMLDLAGVEYDAVDRKLRLDPVLPGAWDQTGLSQTYPCGEVTYRLERPIGGAVHKLTLKVRLKHPVHLDVTITCPGLNELGPWTSCPETPPPRLDPKTGRLAWPVELPEGDSTWSWTWG